VPGDGIWVEVLVMVHILAEASFAIPEASCF